MHYEFDMILRLAVIYREKGREYFLFPSFSLTSDFNICGISGWQIF